MQQYPAFSQTLHLCNIGDTLPCTAGCSEAAPSDAGQNLGYVDPHQKETQYEATEVRIKQSVQPEPEGYSRDVRSAFSGLPKVKPQWRDNYMKMMIVGECGQGQPPTCSRTLYNKHMPHMQPWQ